MALNKASGYPAGQDSKVAETRAFLSTYTTIEGVGSFHFAER